MTEHAPIPLIRFRVTVRSHNFATAEITAPETITTDNLREILFGMIERGEVDWDTDSAETQAIPLYPVIEDTPAPPDPTNPDYDHGAE